MDDNDSLNDVDYNLLKKIDRSEEEEEEEEGGMLGTFVSEPGARKISEEGEEGDGMESTKNPEDSPVAINNSDDVDDILLISNCRQFYSKRLSDINQIKLESASSVKHVNLESASTQAGTKNVNQSNEMIDDDPSSSSSATTRSINDKFSQLRREMADLMEWDMSLMNTLLNLSERMDEVKAEKQICAAFKCWSPTSSSLYSASPEQSRRRTGYEISDHRQMNDRVAHRSSTEDEVEEDGELSPKPPPRRTHFSRQNSILRIPIPPPASRSATYRSSLKPIPSIPLQSDQEDTSSGISTNSGGSIRSKTSERSSRPTSSIIRINDAPNDVDDIVLLRWHTVENDISRTSSSFVTIQDPNETSLTPSNRHQSQASFDSGILVTPTDDHSSLILLNNKSSPLYQKSSTEYGKESYHNDDMPSNLSATILLEDAPKEEVFV